MSPDAWMFGYLSGENGNGFIGHDIRLLHCFCTVFCIVFVPCLEPDMKHLFPHDFYTSGWMPRLFQRYHNLTEYSENRIEVLFFNWWRGCLDLAIQLRGYTNLMVDAAVKMPGIMRFQVKSPVFRSNWQQCTNIYKNSI